MNKMRNTILAAVILAGALAWASGEAITGVSTFGTASTFSAGLLSDSIDAASATTLVLGGSVATGVDVADNGVAFTVKGTTDFVVTDGVSIADAYLIEGSGVGDVRLEVDEGTPNSLAVRLGDDSGYTGLECSTIQVNATGTATLPAISFAFQTSGMFGVSGGLAFATSTVETLRVMNGTGATFVFGYQATPVTRIATSDGLTTGVIAAGTSVVTTTVATDADDIVTLPAVVIGTKVRIYVGATGHEVRTVASSNVTINNVDSDGTNELALLASSSYTFECVSATAWIARGFDNVGADLAALVPD